MFFKFKKKKKVVIKIASYNDLGMRDDRRAMYR